MDHEQFESLNPEEQAKVFHESPFKERADLILHSHHPERLAQSLSEEELYLVARELDLEERSEIIRFANLAQLLFISDVECWKKDRIHAKGFLGWIETLKEADERKLLGWLVAMDYETVVAGFKHLIRVIKPEWEYPSDELLGDEPYFTLDERYFIFVSEENIETVRRAIEILFENHKGRYVAILEGVLGEWEDIVEEEAYRRRETRLADRGFPDPETAHRIYRPLTDHELENHPPKRRDTTAEKPILKVTHYPLLWSRERFFLDDVLLLFRQGDPRVAEGIEEELAWLSNKVIACEGIDFSSEERVRRGAERVRRFVSIGLEILSGGDLASAFRWMQETWVELIFRRAVTRLLELHSGAQDVLHLWKGEQGTLLEFLAPPYEWIFRGLIRVVPEFYDASMEEDANHLRDFKNINEIHQAALALEQIRKIVAWLIEKCPADLESVKTETQKANHAVSLFSMLGTLYARFVTEEALSAEPLTQKAVRSFITKAFEGTGARRSLRPFWKEKFFNAYFSREDGSLLKALWSLVFQALEEELGGLAQNAPIDANYVSAIRILGDSATTKKGRTSGLSK